MEGTYDILLGGAMIGQAQVDKEGLFLRFRCRCRLSGEVIYQLTVSDGCHTEKLGIPVPESGWFVLDTRLPAKRLENAPLFIRAVPRHGELSGFIPVKPEEPFMYLSRIKDAYLAVRDGQAGILLRARLDDA
jgi:hypothetical protein